MDLIGEARDAVMPLLKSLEEVQQEHGETALRAVKGLWNDISGSKVDGAPDYWPRECGSAGIV